MLTIIDENYICPLCGNVMQKLLHRFEHPKKVIIKCTTDGCKEYEISYSVEREVKVARPVIS